MASFAPRAVAPRGTRVAGVTPSNRFDASHTQSDASETQRISRGETLRSFAIDCAPLLQLSVISCIIIALAVGIGAQWWATD